MKRRGWRGEEGPSSKIESIYCDVSRQISRRDGSILGTKIIDTLLRSQDRRETTLFLDD